LFTAIYADLTPSSASTATLYSTIRSEEATAAPHRSGRNLEEGYMRKHKSYRTAGAIGLIAIAMIVMGAGTAAAEGETTVTIGIPERVVLAYAEYGIDRTTLEKSYSDLTWEEKHALNDLEADEGINAAINTAIVMSLMSEMSPKIDAVSTRIAGTVYTHSRPEEDDDE